MKKYLSLLGIVVFTVAFVFLLQKCYKEYNISIMDKNLKCILNYKGLKGAQDFASDGAGNFYVAFKNRIQFIGSKGDSYDILKDDNLEINSLEYTNGELYYASKCQIYCYSLKDKKQRVIMSDLPNLGDYKDSCIRIKEDNIYISIGAATNSGVVGSDNKWLKENPFFYDLSPNEIVLKGKNFGSEKTGAFVSYKTKNVPSQVISGHFPGNASIIVYNIKDNSSRTFAWGIRNVTGMDFNSEGKLLAATGGMEKRGIRPVVGDYDYVYEINNNVWYGWPDYSGGDPINSPRFRVSAKEKIDFILDKHPSSSPPAPLYQHKGVGSMGSIAIDKFEYLGEKDSIYFYDIKDNNICELNKNNILSEKIKLNKASKVTSIKFLEGKLSILDSEQGCIYTLVKNK